MNLTQTVAWFHQHADTLEDKKGFLTELDSAIGDSDHGTNMARGWQAVKEELKGFDGQISDCFMLVSKTLISRVGGASGPLYGTAFLRMATTLKDKTAIELQDWPKMLRAACEGIEVRGKVKGGEKTMYDVWEPLARKLEQHSPFADEVSLAAWMAQTAEALASETKKIKATKGRAAYLGDRSLGHLDPGAVSTSLLFKSLHDSLTKV